ncbi:hypothetical protein C2G38_2232638 [Gigaspora rosea]|uniref:Uncharacterized protein n=1 Tax=Gigaspora rosea TaxID=44941 RepID=A0A397TVX6_9GLOM|nr:hypothetical protein C2G38_2232638 [Gigaspora rosea]
MQAKLAKFAIEAAINQKGEKVQERFNKYDITKSPSMQNLIDCCIGYAKNKDEVEEPRLFLSMEKNPIRARELLIWIQRSILDKFPFLLKDKDRNTNIVLFNQFLSRHRITSFILRKIGANLASKVHGGRNDSYYQYLRQLACRHKIGHASSVEHNGVINDRPNTPAH